MDLQAVRATATDIARQAGAELLRFYDQPHQEATKQNIIDIVTEGDQASEAIIVAALRQAFPNHHIVGEEGGGQGAPADEAEYSWYVDPLDGTSNFASNIPLFTVSIALSDRTRRPLVGVVFCPVYNELYTAARGFGATLNGKPIHVSQKDELHRAMLSTGFPYDKTQQPNNVREWGNFLMRVRGILRLGSAALDLAWVAAGRLDGFWEPRLNSWDILAGLLLVEEAGGTVTDYSDSSIERAYQGIEVVASNGQIHEQMLAVLAETETAPLFS
jgi:myo-inositol-1(or 4)-monophosphatase